MPYPYLSSLLAPLAAFIVQSSQPPAPPAVVLPPVIVTAAKDPADAQRLPLAVTAVSSEALAAAGVESISEAAPFAPNARVVEMSARKISNAFVRGIGSSPSNPGITTVVDGVPQLNSISSSTDLLDLERIEFVRGPQSALFGRNALGGVVNLTSARPSLSSWSGRVAVPFGTASAVDVRAGASGPVSQSVGLGLSYRHSQRDGFTTNDVTGHAVDNRFADAGKAQLLWVPDATWEVRLVGFGERARDGDYALADLDQARSRPFHVSRDYEGRTDRDIWSGTAIVRHDGPRVVFSSTTGYVAWSARDLTDLDYSPMPLMTRDNAEDDRQFTQELRLASAPRARVRLSDGVSLAWQTGLFLFTQNYTQDAVNTFAPYVLSPMVPVAVAQRSPTAALDDWGVGLYGQGTLTWGEVFDLGVGARFDHEDKSARIQTSYAPPIAPPTSIDQGRTYSDVSPQFSAAYRYRPGQMIYGTASRGFKAGGFNSVSPAGQEAYGPEQAWNVEGGIKTTLAAGRATVTADVFRIDWQHMQLNVPNPLAPGQFYIANAGAASSTGAEVELAARASRGLDLLAGVGLTHGRFGAGTTSSGTDVSGHELPNAPEYTLSFGAQYSWARGASIRGYVRGDLAVSGGFSYDETNRQGQQAYSLVHLRASVEAHRLECAAWVRNAFDARYVPVAFAYPGLTASGYLGEPGHPRTFGVSVGARF